MITLETILGALGHDAVEDKNHYLVVFGTDTKLQIEPDPFYHRGELLSWFAHFLNAFETPQGTAMPDKTLSLFTPSIQVIQGPMTKGWEVGDRIMHTTLSLLYAAAQGKEVHLGISHSRGALIYALALQHVEHVKKALEKISDDSISLGRFIQIIKDAPSEDDRLTRDAWKKYFKTCKDTQAPTQISKTLLLQRLGALLAHSKFIDPVAGQTSSKVVQIANTVGLYHNWQDPLFDQRVPCITAEQVVFENEMTAFFSGQILNLPNRDALNHMPGHHGTGSGNLADQRGMPASNHKKRTPLVAAANASPPSVSSEAGKAVETAAIETNVISQSQEGGAAASESPVKPQEYTTGTVQRLMFWKELMRLEMHFHLSEKLQNESTLNSVLRTDHPFSSSLNGLARKFYTMTPPERKQKLLELYDKVKINHPGYEHFNETSYPHLARQNIEGQRPVFYKKEYHPATAFKPKVSTDFVNHEHAALYLEITFNIESNQIMVQLLKDLGDVFKSIEDAVMVGGEDDTSSRNRLLKLLESESSHPKLLSSIQMLVESISQKYLNNNISMDEKKELLKTLTELMQTLKTSMPSPKFKGTVNRCLEIVQLGFQSAIKKRNHSFDVRLNALRVDLAQIKKQPPEQEIIDNCLQTLSEEGDRSAASTPTGREQIKSMRGLASFLEVETERLAAEAKEIDAESEEFTEKTAKISKAKEPLENYLSPRAHLEKLGELYLNILHFKQAHASLIQLSGIPLDTIHTEEELRKLLKEITSNAFEMICSQKLEATFEGILENVPELIAKIQKRRTYQEIDALQQQAESLLTSNVALSTQLQRENHLLRIEIRGLEERLTNAEHTIQAQAVLNDSANTKAELTIGELRLLTEDYLTHLKKPQQESQDLSDKKAFVEELLNILQQDGTTTPLVKLNKFSVKLNVEITKPKALQTLTKHRAPFLAFLKSCAVLLGIVFTGVVPGLIGLGIYAGVTGRSIGFFGQSHGERYLGDCKKEINQCTLPLTIG